MYSTQTTAQLTKEYRPKLNHRCSRAGLKKLFTTKPERGFVTPDPIKHIVEPSLTPGKSLPGCGHKIKSLLQYHRKLQASLLLGKTC
jgi:hypothetical protein